MERTEARPHLNLPHHVVLSLLSGKVEEIEGHLKAVEGGALFGVIDQEKWWGVINHSLLVRRVAMGMANLANQVHKGDQSWCNINVDLVGNGGLLEDFAKRYEKEYPGMDHVQAGVRILDDESINFPNKDRIKKMLVTHLYGMDGYNDEPANWEEKIIVLADHYATGEVVSLEERFADFKSRQVHGQTMSTEETEFWRIHDYCYAAQKEFMDTVGTIDESQLIAFLKNLPATAEEIKLREILRRQPEKAPRIVLAVERLQRIQAREKEAREKRNTVIFDFGGVITEDPDPEMINNMVGLSGIEAGRLEGALNQVVPLMQRGQIDEELACRQLEQILNIQIKVKAEDFFATKFKIKEETKALIDELVDKGFRVAVLTNTIPSHFIRIKQLLLDTFSGLNQKDILASFELKTRKEGRNKKREQPDIFQMALDRLAIKAENAVIVDDNPNYVSQARDDGIASLLIKPKSIDLKEALFSKLTISPG